MGNKFRRGQRVWFQWAGHTEPTLATVVNAKPNSWGYIKVRCDDQQEWERGRTVKEDQVEPLMTNDNQYHKRQFNLMWLTHADVKELRDAPLSVNLKARIMALPGFVP